MLLSLFTALPSRAQVASESALKEYVEYLSSPSIQGRKAGSVGERAAARYLTDKLKAAGVTMLSGDEGDEFTIDDSLSAPLVSRNVFGIVEGSDPVLKNEYIVVGTHLDGLGSHVLNDNGTRRALVYPGASSDAASMAALAEIARYAASGEGVFRRSVIFAAFGSSLKGFAGSWFFANRSFEYVSDVKLMISLDNLGRGDRDNPFKVFSTLSRTDLVRLMDSASVRMVAKEPLVTNETVPSSDHLPFYTCGVPTVLFTTGRNPESGTLNDTSDLIPYPELRKMCSYVDLFAEAAADADAVSSSLLKLEETGKDDGVYGFNECDKRPKFLRGDELYFLKTWVYKYLKYPDEAVRQGIMGTVVVSFVIEKDGTVSDVAVEKSAGGLLDEAALKVVNSSPKWIPGEVSGKKVRASISLPIEFRLQKK